MESLWIALSAVIIWALLLAFLRVYRIWLPFYVLGAGGLAVAVVYFGRDILPFQAWLRTYTALHAHYITVWLGVPTQLVEASPHSLLVSVINQGSGWTTLNIDMERSGLLEISAVVGLLLFYPAWPLPKRFLLMAVGLLGTYVANIVGVLIIVFALHWGGGNTLFIAHTVIARAVFFLLTVLLYWYIITKPTIKTIGVRLRQGERA